MVHSTNAASDDSSSSPNGLAGRMKSEPLARPSSGSVTAVSASSSPIGGCVSAPSGGAASLAPFFLLRGLMIVIGGGKPGAVAILPGAFLVRLAVGVLAAGRAAAVPLAPPTGDVAPGSTTPGAVPSRRDRRGSGGGATPSGAAGGPGGAGGAAICSRIAWLGTSRSSNRMRMPGRPMGPPPPAKHSLTAPVPLSSGRPSARVTENCSFSPTGFGVRVAMKIDSRSQKRRNIATNWACVSHPDAIRIKRRAVSFPLTARDHCRSHRGAPGQPPAPDPKKGCA
jgi:hypothetical protein